MKTPHDETAEKAIIASIFIDPIGTAPAIFKKILLGDFYREPHRIIYQAALDLHREGTPPGFIAVAQRLSSAGRLAEIGGGAYLDECRDAEPTAETWKHHARIIKNMAKRRATVDAAQIVAQVALRGDDTTEAVAALAEIGTDPEPDTWGDPRLFGEIDTPELPPDLLPGFLGEYCKAVAFTTQTPPGMAVMFALAVVATCLQKRFEVSPFPGGHKETLSIWTVAALDPGNRKTAVKNALTAPLAEWESEQAETRREEITTNNNTRAVLIKRSEKLKELAAKTDDPIERHALIGDMGKVVLQTPEEMFPPRLFTGDVTPERLQGLLCDNGERMALLSDEGGIFEVMAGLYSDGKANIDVFLQSHPGAPVRVDRSSRTVTLNRPALSFGLTVQPDIISDLGSNGKKRFRGNGCLARFLYCVPRSTVGLRDVRARNPIPEPVKTAFREGVRRLLDIQPAHDDQGREQARILTLSPAALECWHGFSEYIEKRIGHDGDLYPLQDWAGKLPGAALRIAGLFHVVRYGEQTATIDQETTEAALDLAELLIPHAQAAFDLMGADPADRDANVVLRWIQKQGAAIFKKNSVLCQGGVKQIKTAVQLDKALQALVDRHIISTPRKVPTGGRPSEIIGVNPGVISRG